MDKTNYFKTQVQAQHSSATIPLLSSILVLKEHDRHGKGSSQVPHIHKSSVKDRTLRTSLYLSENVSWIYTTITGKETIIINILLKIEEIY